MLTLGGVRDFARAAGSLTERGSAAGRYCLHVHSQPLP